MLALDHVTKQFDEEPVLRELSLRFEAQQTHVLLGPSGCGKSTVLRLLIGLESPNSGRVLLDDAPLSALDLGLMRRRFGYVIQEGGLFPHLSAAENVQLMGKYLKWPQRRASARTRELAELMQLPQEMLQRYPGQLSGGQRQRISLMRALFLNPDILLLDEPLGALDPMIRNELQRELKRIFLELKKTVVLVTHDLAEAAYLGHNITLLHQGCIAQRGTADELLRQPASSFVDEFVSAQRGWGSGGLADGGVS
jgi:osmoprotectant transport system ATP-binding protein